MERNKFPIWEIERKRTTTKPGLNRGQQYPSFAETHQLISQVAETGWMLSWIPQRLCRCLESII